MTEWQREQTITQLRQPSLAEYIDAMGISGYNSEKIIQVSLRLSKLSNHRTKDRGWSYDASADGWVWWGGRVHVGPGMDWNIVKT